MAKHDGLGCLSAARNRSRPGNRMFGFRPGPAIRGCEESVGYPPADMGNTGLDCHMSGTQDAEDPKAAMAIDSDQIGTGWQAQVLRLTTFLSTPLDPNVAATLWTLATSTIPEADDNRPREGIRRQAGPFEDGQLEILIAANRIDWIMAPRADQNAIPQPYFATLDRAMQVFVASGQQWLQIGPPSVIRLALGAVLLMPGTDKVETYQKLKDMLKAVHVDPIHSSELFYQINWPRQSKVIPELKLNRLTKWAPIVIRAHSLQLGGVGLQPLPGSGAHYCQLECDHNTAEEHVEPFGPTQVDELFQELCKLAIDNARNGEVRAET
jgi:hypothetical protein